MLYAMTDMLCFATATYSLKKAAYRIMIAGAAFFVYDIPVMRVKEFCSGMNVCVGTFVRE